VIPPEPAPGETVPPAPAPAIKPVPPVPPSIDFAMAPARGPLVVPKHLGCLVKMIFGFFVLILMGYFALMAMSPKARKWATSAEGPTPFKAVNQVLAIPAQVIGKTKDVVATNDARVGVLDKVIADEEANNTGGGSRGHQFVLPESTPAPANDKGVSSDIQNATKEKPAVLPENFANRLKNDSVNVPLPPARLVKPKDQPDANALPARITLGGGIVIESASPPGAPAASQDFLRWVMGITIRGVMQGKTPRMLLNNRLTYQGQEVNAALGITFDHLEPDKKLVVFRDKSGALVTLTY
jgi:energy-converting hydrogenase Eha subunit A